MLGNAVGQRGLDWNGGAWCWLVLGTGLRGMRQGERDRGREGKQAEMDSVAWSPVATSITFNIIELDRLVIRTHRGGK